MSFMDGPISSIRFLCITCLVSRSESVESPVRGLELAEAGGEEQLVRRGRRGQKVLGGRGGRGLLDQVRHHLHCKVEKI